MDAATGQGDDEQQCFFLKMKADYHRYIATVTKEKRLDDCRAEAFKFYQQAMRLKVHPGSPTRLGLILNFAIFQAEIMKNFGEAMNLLDKGQADSIDKVEEMDDE